MSYYDTFWAKTGCFMYMKSALTCTYFWIIKLLSRICLSLSLRPLGPGCLLSSFVDLNRFGDLICRAWQETLQFMVPLSLMISFSFSISLSLSNFELALAMRIFPLLVFCWAVKIRRLNSYWGSSLIKAFRGELIWHATVFPLLSGILRSNSFGEHRG